MAEVADSSSARPAQVPASILPDLVAAVGGEVDLGATVITAVIPCGKSSV